MRAALLVVLVATTPAVARCTTGPAPGDRDAAAATQTPQPAAPGGSQERLFPPEELGTLEGPDRAEWQQPDKVMDLLGIAEGTKVADLGAGGGWFTTRLAHRVGPNGVVYAEDVQSAMIEAIKRRVQQEGLANVKTILGTPVDPLLPAGLHAVLIVDSYSQFPDAPGLLRKVAAALTSNGVVGVVDFKTAGAGGPGPPVEARVDPQTVIRDATAAGLRLRNQDASLRYQYVLVFAK